MKSLVKYIFIVLCLLVSCQRAELEDTSSDVPKDETSLGKATISFSVNVPVPEVSTKAMGDNPIDDIENLYLIVFDENGYFVEACEAELVGDSDTTHVEDETNLEHKNERNYTVTLSLTDQKRIIHFIANCPADQIRYGNEYEVISNMYVTKGQAIETAYWYRVQVPYILLKDNNVNLKDEIREKLTCVPLLRNYTQITVKRGTGLTDDEFKLESFAVYNTINVGTVAPYNKSGQTFQMFYDADGLYTYDELLELGYEGHALARATLDNTLVDESPANTDFIDPEAPFYMYERKISVHTSEEDKWDESPAHIIIKGKYNKSETSTYYKLDLVRKVGTGTDIDNQYYNLLRNFKYVFTLNDVNGPGYSSLADAMAHPAGNNLSGATDTQGFTNLSDGRGRIFVSYADTTLVTSDNIKLKYKYIPDLKNADVTANDKVSIRPAITDQSGAVIKSLVSTTGPDSEGWTTFEFSIQDIGAIEKNQEIKLHVSDNPNLHKTIRYSLRRPYAMEVKCDPKKIYAGIGKEISLKIGIPDDLTENLFPLDFMIEVDKLSLGPDAKKGSILSVEGGKSIIPGQAEKQAFHYHYILEYDSYTDPALPVVNGQKIINIDWVTNTVQSAARVYVVNKYFNNGSDNFINVDKAFKDLVVNPGNIFYGTGETASIEFNLDDKENANDAAYTSKNITVTLNGLEDADGNSTLTVHPTAGSKTITIGNLHTTTLDGNVSFSVSEDNYADATSAEATRHQGQFKNLTIVPSPIFVGTGKNAKISFTMDDADTKYASRAVTVKLNGLKFEGEAAITGGTVAENNSNILTINPNARTVTIDGLLTTTTSLPVSFTVEEPCYAQAVSAEVSREQYQFNDLTISPDPIAMGTGQTVSVSFSKDLADNSFASREVTVILEGLETADGQGEITYDANAHGESITIADLRTTSNSDQVKVTVKTDGYDYAPAVATADRDWYEFRDVKINDGKAVQEGTERPVKISFKKDADDATFTSKTLTIKLNGLERDGSTTISGGTFVENIDGGFTVKPTAETVTIEKLLTTTQSGQLSFTVGEETYSNGEAAVGRRKGRFTIENTGFNKTNLGVNKDEEVEFRFTLSDYEEGMTVYVDLENLVPADGSLTGPVTRAFSTYEYKPQDETCTIKLKTEKDVEKDGENVCKIKLRADNYENSEEKSITQQNPKINHTIETLTITFTWNGNGEPNINNVKDPSFSITNGTITTGNITKTKNKKTYTITVKDVVLGNVDSDAKITISCEAGNGFNRRTFRYTISVKDLIKNSNPTVTLTQ